MKSKTLHVLATCIVGVGLIGGASHFVFAQEAEGAEAAPKAAAKAAPAQGGPKRGDMPDYNEVIKDMTPIPGMMTLFRNDANDPTKDHTRLLVQIPRALIGQDLLMANSISRGAEYGMPLDDGVLVRWEMNGNRVMLMAPDPRFVETPGAIVNDAVEGTYTPAIISGFPIITLSPGGDPVIDLTPMVMGNAVGLPMQGEPRRDLSRYTKIKNFPENMLIDVDLAFGGRGGGGGSIGVSYALRKLPNPRDYQPRIADERIGYFTSVRQDWGIKHSERENLVRYVNRWNLKKKDPSLDLSPPEKPIVFIIEKTVPLQWRKYVAEGILSWNVAFEKIGYTGAVVVQQQTDDNEFANIDPEDARYNFFRWIVTGQPFAMGPSRPDPRTGQLLDADIVFDDSFLRYELKSFDLFGPNAMSTQMGPELKTFFKQFPQYLPAGQQMNSDMPTHPQGELMTDAKGGGNGQDKAPFAPWLRRNAAAAAQCTYGEGLQHQLAFSQLAMLASNTGKKLPERFVGQVIREVVAHELGHTLGLRHNFKASSWLSLDEVKRRRDSTDEPTFASVMDYNPILFFPGDEVEKVKNFISPCIGPYDAWAIEYGYTTTKGDEKEALGKIAAKGTAKELAYATDEDTMGLSSVDPLVNRYDMSDDPAGWAKTRIELCDSLMKNVKTWAVQKDEPNFYLRSAYGTLLSEKSRNLFYVSRFIGGQYFSRNRAGDPAAKAAFTLVEPKTQRELLALINDSVLSDNFFTTDPDLLNDLGPSRWSDWASNPMARLDYPIHAAILSMQSSSLLTLTSPQVLQRVYDSELKSKSDDKFTAAELIHSVRDMVFTDLDSASAQNYTDSKPMINSIRRNLQQQYLSNMLATASLPSGSLISPDLQSMVRYSLRELRDKLKSATETGGKGKIDFASKAHLSEMQARITKVLDAPMVTLSLGGLGMSMDGQTATGSSTPAPQQP